MDHSQRKSVRLRISPHDFIFDSQQKSGCLASSRSRDRQALHLCRFPTALTRYLANGVNEFIVGVCSFVEQIAAWLRRRFEKLLPLLRRMRRRELV